MANNRGQNKGRGAGRPTSFKDEYCDVVKEMCLNGATDRDIYKALGISHSTFYEWKFKYVNFAESLDRSKVEFDMNVESTLLKMALGEHVEETIETDADGQVIKVRTITKAPDLGAIKLWLTNRQPDVWKDKQHIESNVNVKHDPYEELSAEELRKLIAMQEKETE